MCTLFRNEQLCSWTFNFCKVVLQQIWGQMVDFVPAFFCSLSERLRMRQWKKAFSSRVIRSVIFQVLHFPALWFSPSFFSDLVRHFPGLLRQSCLVFTNVTSALLFVNVMHYMNPRFTYLLLLTFIKPAISAKRLKIERKLLLMAYIKSLIHGLSIAAKMYDLEWPLREIQGNWFLKCCKMAKYGLVMTPTPCRMAWMHYIC